MIRLFSALGLALLPLPLAAADLPPGLVSAELLPATVQPDGTLLTALHLELAPGWKTYWRSPGETGVPPVMDWSGVPNVASAAAEWPRPEVIQSDGTTTLGYHDRLVLPIRLTLADPARPAEGRMAMDFGLCQNICVPAHVELSAPQAGGTTPDPRITAALADRPQPGAGPADCTVTEIEDGLRIAASVPAGTARAAAIEVDAPGMWVSEPALTTADGTVTATADVVGPTGKPFPLDRGTVRLTLIADGGAVEYQGCAPS